MKVKEIAPQEIAGQALFEMANLRPKRTGLPFVALISQKGRARPDVRVKLARGAKVRPSDMITIAVRPRPRIIQGEMSTREFSLGAQRIKLNRNALGEHWNGVIEYTEDGLNAIPPVGDTRDAKQPDDRA